LNLKAFQNANEMEATGQLDKKTAEAIQTKIIEKIRSGVTTWYIT
jgi:carboxyl-terminal processing protease